MEYELSDIYSMFSDGLLYGFALAAVPWLIGWAISWLLSLFKR